MSLETRYYKHSPILLKKHKRHDIDKSIIYVAMLPITLNGNGTPKEFKLITQEEVAQWWIDPIGHLVMAR
jgi:hypothetical protein